MNQVINLGAEVAERVKQTRIHKQLQDLDLRVYLLETLIKRLDPDHTYIWSAEYGAFIREPVNEKTDNPG